MSDINELLAPIPGENPCGPDLEYDPEFVALESAARGKPEQQIGDAQVAAEDADWADVGQRAHALLGRSKDLRVAVLLTRSAARLSDFGGLLTGVNLIKGLVAANWDHVHPRVDPDDGDPLMRLNVIAALADPQALVRDVRTMYLVRPGPTGSVTVRDVLLVAGKQEATTGEATRGAAEVSGILVSQQLTCVAAVNVVRETSQAVRELHKLLADKVAEVNEARQAQHGKIDSSDAPDLGRLSSVLEGILPFCEATLGMSASGAGVPADGAQGAGVLSDLRTRDDAVRLLNKVCDFIERTEPSHPAPLLLRRAGRLMNKNFMQIIEDLAPDGVSQIQRIAGTDAS